MIDYVTFKLTYSNAEFHGLVTRLGLIVPIDSLEIKFNWSGLRFVYYPNSNILKISNSLHKFYNLCFNTVVKEPINYNDFSFSNCLTATYYLSNSLLERDETDIEVSSRLEFGVNINTDFYRPFNLILKYQSCITTFANEFFTIPPYRGKPLQRSCYFSDWHIKAYDKGKQAGVINTNLLRYEVVITQLRKLRLVLKSTRVSLAEISSLESWKYMSQYLIYTYDRIRKIPHIENVDLTVKEINAIYGYSNKLMRSDLMLSNHRYAFDLLNNKNKKIFTRFNDSPSNYHNVVRQKMIGKLEHLLTN